MAVVPAMSVQHGGSAAPGAPAPPRSDQCDQVSKFHEPQGQGGFAIHLQQHSKPQRQQCKWARCRRRWMRATPLHPAHYLKTPWLEVSPSTSASWGLGCWVCRQAKFGNDDDDASGPFVTCGVRRPSKARRLKHHRSNHHARSVLALVHQRGLAAAEDDGAPAPPVADFANLLQRIRRNELEATSRSCRRKHTTMAWCLYEAHRDKERKFLAKAVCMSIAQDASTRGPLLLTRYVACGPSLERASGILRVADAKQISGAPDLAKSVLRGIRAMATKRRPHASMYNPARPAKRLKGFARHLASITEVFVADGASDEQLAGRMLVKGSARGMLADTLPNLRRVVRDKPHSARRLLQRTLPTDAFIGKLMTTLLWSRGSLARLVQHSPQFQEKFKRHQRRVSPGGKLVKDLSYAKQRFDSTARPLGRMVAHFEALLQTAMDIVRERGPSTKEHRSANQALELLDTEHMLQLGMVADACEVVVRFIRFLGKECFDISALPAHIETLVASATELFRNGGCLKHAGYTRQMLALIKRPAAGDHVRRTAQDLG